MIKLQMNLSNVMQQGMYKGMVLRKAIDKDPNYISSLREFGGLKLDADALCYLINAKSDYLEKMGKFTDMGRKTE